MDEINSNRKYDDSQEQIISNFLIDNYFRKINSTARLIYDDYLQKHGVDVQLENNDGNTINIDVKAQSSAKYINDPRPTFVLELSSYNRYGTKTFVGWFLNEKMITDYYTFVWIHSATVNEKGLIESVDDIHRLEVMTVSKSKLKDYITSILVGTDVNAIIDEMRANKETRRDIVNGIHFSHSPHLPEKPVNIVVHKRILEKFSIGKTGRYFVTKEGIFAPKKYR